MNKEMSQEQYVGTVVEILRGMYDRNGIDELFLKVLMRKNTRERIDLLAIPERYLLKAAQTPYLIKLRIIAGVMWYEDSIERLKRDELGMLEDTFEAEQEND